MSLKEVITLLDMASPAAKIGSEQQGLPAQSRPFPRYETPPPAISLQEYASHNCNLTMNEADTWAVSLSLDGAMVIGAWLARCSSDCQTPQRGTSYPRLAATIVRVKQPTIVTDPRQAIPKGRY